MDMPTSALPIAVPTGARWDATSANPVPWRASAIRPAPSPPWRRASAAGACCGAARPCFAPATPCSICISCAPAPEDPRHQSRRAGTDHRVSGLWRPARLDAIESGFHACDAIALEDSLLCALPYAQLVANCGLDPLAARQFHRLIAHDINHCQRLLLTLGRMSTDERIASFLVETSEQMAAHGYSAREFILKMTREDIANYLGMEIETVSRVFSRLQAASLLQVSKRHLKLPDIDALRRMSSG